MLAQNEGLLVELCWDTSTTADLDLYLHRPNDRTPWFALGSYDVLSGLDSTTCSGANCVAGLRFGLSRVDWGYPDSELGVCRCRSDRSCCFQRRVRTFRGMRWPIALGVGLLLAIGACDREPEPKGRAISDAGAVREPLADFSGSYDSNWGPVECTQNESEVRCVYQRMPAKLECEASGRRLRCKWTERKGRGRAKFTRHPNGNLVGTWGHGQSEENKGAWMLTKK